MSAVVGNRSCKFSLMYMVSFKVLDRVRNRIQRDSFGCRSPLGTNFVDTPLVVPVRGWFDGIRRFMRGDYYIGRGSTQRGLKRSRFCNDFKVSVYGRDEAIWRFEQKLKSDAELRESLWTLSGLRLVCHCTQAQECHGDAIIHEFRRRYPDAYDRNLPTTGPPSSRVLNYLACLREEPESDEGSSADEGVPEKGAGWTGRGEPMMVGVGYTAREFCDGQSLASPGRWPIEQRRYPESGAWKAVAALFMTFAEREGTPQLLADLALGKVKACPFEAARVRELKEESLDILSKHGLVLQRTGQDRRDVPIDFRYLQLLLTAAQDPEIGLGSFASGVRVGPGARLPRLPALYAPKKRWRLAEQSDPVRYQEERVSGEQVWRRNYSTLVEFTDQVLEVMEDQAKRGQVLKLSEAEAKARFPNLVVASLGAQRKEKPGGIVTARVLFDGTHGIDVNTSTRIRDQERAPIAADLKRAMREKARLKERTFSLTADVSEAHRQVPIAPQDWHLLGCQVQPGSTVYVNTVGTFGVTSASYYWSRTAAALGRLTQYFAGGSAHTWHMLVADDYHLEAGGQSYRSALMVFFVLCAVSGVPLSWHKTAGGDEVTWVGFELLHRSHSLGISQRRAQWFTRWCREVAASGHVLMNNFEEGLGRIMYVAGALEFERPFLAPLYRYLNLHPRDSVRRVPAYVAFILRYLADQVEESRHSTCASELRPIETAPRVDAQASGGKTGVGGWWPVLDESGAGDANVWLPYFRLNRQRSKDNAIFHTFSSYWTFGSPSSTRSRVRHVLLVLPQIWCLFPLIWSVIISLSTRVTHAV